MQITKLNMCNYKSTKQPEFRKRIKLDQKRNSIIGDGKIYDSPLPVSE